MEELHTDLLQIIASYLPRGDLPALFRSCAEFSTLAQSEALWEEAWPWECEKHLGRIPLHASSWREAHGLCCCYRRGVVAVEPSEEYLLSDITCAVYANSSGVISRIYGGVDGTVTVLTAGKPARTFNVGAGSVRHMQLVGNTRANTQTQLTTTTPGIFCFVGSWEGTVHVIDLIAGTVREVVSGLNGPVYGLRIAGSSLIACTGGGSLSTWRLWRDSMQPDDPSTLTPEPNRITGAQRTGVLEGHTGAVTDFAVQKLRMRVASSRKRAAASSEAVNAVAATAAAATGLTGVISAMSGVSLDAIRGGAVHALQLSPVAASPVPRNQESSLRLDDDDANDDEEDGGDGLDWQVTHHQQQQQQSSRGESTSAPSAMTNTATAADISSAVQNITVALATDKPAPPDPLRNPITATASSIDARSYFNTGSAYYTGGAYVPPRAWSTTAAYNYDGGGAGTSPRVNRVVSCSYDGTLRVWDLENCVCLAELEGHRGPVWTVAVMGNYIFSGGADGTVRIWRTWTVSPLSTSSAAAAAPSAAAGERSNGLSMSAAAAEKPGMLFTDRAGSRSRKIGSWTGSNDGSTGCCATGATTVSNRYLGASNYLDAPAQKGSSSCSNGSSGTTAAAAVRFHPRPAPPPLPAPIGWTCIAVLSPYPSAVTRRQVFCLKVVGGCLIAGTSDGSLYCYDARLPQVNVCPDSLLLKHRGVSALERTGEQQHTSTSPAVGITSGLPSTPTVASPLNASTPDTRGLHGSSAVSTPGGVTIGLLWSYTFAHVGGTDRRDGIRRVDVVGRLLYAITQGGSVHVLRFAQ